MTGVITDSEGQAQRKWSGAVPIRIIRKVDLATGAQELIGDVGFDRQGYQGDTSMTSEQQEEQRQLNESYEDGDERIEWDFGGECEAPTGLMALHRHALQRVTVRFGTYAIIADVWKTSSLHPTTAAAS
jgi:hypothetical protein